MVFLSGQATIAVEGHVTQYASDTATWVSDPAGDTDLLSTGRSRVIMKTLAPDPVRITKRGGEGHDFWGNPHNPEAQYNHVLNRGGEEDEAYRKPPLSPWRLEVEPTSPAARDYFLHLLCITDEGTREMPPAERLEEGNRVGARITLGGREVMVLFNKTGPLGGHLTISEGGKTLHDADLAQGVPED